MSDLSFDVLVCKGPVCAGQRDADSVFARLCDIADRRCDPDQVHLSRKNCFGRCTQGPNVYVRARGAWRIVDPTGAKPPRRGILYNGVTSAHAEDIVEEHLLHGRIAAALIPPPPNDAMTENSMTAAPASVPGHEVRLARRQGVRPEPAGQKPALSTANNPPEPPEKTENL